MASKIQMRRDTATNWTNQNSTLSSGEFGFETDTEQLKIGDGTTAWTSLAYNVGGAGGTLHDYKIWYVDMVNGNDSNSGDFDNPVLTIEQAYSLRNTDGTSDLGSIKVLRVDSSSSIGIVSLSASALPTKIIFDKSFIIGAGKLTGEIVATDCGDLTLVDFGGEDILVLTINQTDTITVEVKIENSSVRVAAGSVNDSLRVSLYLTCSDAYLGDSGDSLSYRINSTNCTVRGEGTLLSELYLLNSYFITARASITINTLTLTGTSSLQVRSAETLTIPTALTYDGTVFNIIGTLDTTGATIIGNAGSFTP